MLDYSAFEGNKDFLPFFEELTKIPRGSGNTKPIANYLEEFAKKRGLEYERDSSDNVIIKKRASRGYESAPAVILQAHTDMVIAKEDFVTRDLTKEGVDVFIDGTFLKARGTTLGADNGMGASFILALLDSADIPLPKIEGVFTSNEEIGLLGAGALDTSLLSGKTYINLDAGTDGTFIAGCAGGVRIDIESEYTKTEVKEYYSVKISGLLGGHSGSMIGAGRVNAIKLIAEMVPSGVSIGDIFGGNADNAIASFVEFKLSDKGDIEERIKAVLDRYAESEKSLTVVCEQVEEKAKLFTKEDTERLLSLIAALPYGPLEMNEKIPNLVESSMNLGIISTMGERVKLTASVRSSSEVKKSEICNRVYAIAEEYKGTCESSGAYPGWEFSKISPIRDTLTSLYKEITGKEAKTVTIHAGLECGIFTSKIEGLDAISMGSAELDIHTTAERASIPSAIRTYELLTTALKRIKE